MTAAVLGLSIKSNFLTRLTSITWKSTGRLQTVSSRSFWHLCYLTAKGSVATKCHIWITLRLDLCLMQTSDSSKKGHELRELRASTPEKSFWKEKTIFNIIHEIGCSQVDQPTWSRSSNSPAINLRSKSPKLAPKTCHTNRTRLNSNATICYLILRVQIV